MKDVEGLLKNGTFKPVNVDEIIDGTCVFGYSFFDTADTFNSGLRYESC